MGIDYDANFGIGVKLVWIDFDDEEDLPDNLKNFCDMNEYIESFEGHENFKVFNIGDFISGDNHEMFITIREPFAEGFDELEIKCLKLINFLARNNIQYEGSIDLVGGLRIW